VDIKKRELNEKERRRHFFSKEETSLRKKKEDEFLMGLPLQKKRDRENTSGGKTKGI